MLIATNVMGFHHVSLLEATLAIALTLRGVEVEMIQCDAALPACLKVERHSFPEPAQFAADGIAKVACFYGNLRIEGNLHQPVPEFQRLSQMGSLAENAKLPKIFVHMRRRYLSVPGGGAGIAGIRKS